MKPERILAGVVGAIVVIAVVAAVVASQRDTVAYDIATPEGVVQSYLRAIIDGDVDEASSHLDPASGCDWEQIGGVGRDLSRAVLLDSEIADDRGRVRVELVFGYGGGPFDTHEYTQEETFRLVLGDDGWLITGSPWPFFACGGNG
ncbi:MAG TPA: hypothetical protein VK011_04305 [Acidimicrobiia bacterium]|nr:hypothetical protein [Acidimicrobiia bacterium]